MSENYLGMEVEEISNTHWPMKNYVIYMHTNWSRTFKNEIIICDTLGRRQNKKEWNFPYFSKPTQPPTLVWKEIKLTLSKKKLEIFQDLAAIWISEIFCQTIPHIEQKKLLLDEYEAILGILDHVLSL